MILGSILDLRIVQIQIVWDTGAKVRDILRAQTATHVREDIDIGAYRDEDDGKAPAMVEAVALTEVLTLYPAPIAGNGTVVSFYPGVDTYLESVWLAE